ncbi:regulatory protein RecX [Candidatus Roizmanbacteria bacterium]|nr:regulatory protein RecX [Candidatus Roizmanbacteria bacterium]
MSKEDLQILLNYAYFYLKFRPRTKKELRDYLYKKIEKRYLSRDVADQAIKELEEKGLISDKAFVEWFVEQRRTGKPKGKFVIKSELLRHGVSKDLIDTYLEEHPLQEEELALKVLQSRWHRFKELSKKERFEKAAAFLVRRGFPFDIIRKTIEKVEEMK